MYVRLADFSDLNFLREMLFEAAYWRESDHKPDLNEGLSKEGISHLLENWGRDGDTAVIAETDGKPVGAAWFRLWTESEHSYGFVSDQIPEIGIAVVSGFRGKGIGKKLLCELIQCAESQQFPAISLSVEKENFACRFYMKLGFKIHIEHQSDYTLIYDLKGQIKSTHP